MRILVCPPESRASLQAEICRALAIFTPKPPMTLSEYQREPMDAISDPRIRKVVFMWASQTGKSQIQINAIGYFSHHDPAYMLMIQPTLDRAEEFSKIRIAPTIRDTPVLRDLYPDPRARDSGNTLLLKEFPGGWLALVGANSPSGLASKPVRILFPDEVDRFDESAGAEGDALDLAYIRLTTFWNSKAVETSTPLIKGTSRIDQSFDDSDKRFYFVRCPHCGLEQKLEWPRLRYVTEETAQGKLRVVDVWYECASGDKEQSALGCRIDESSKFEMVRQGRWNSTAESVDGRTAGFHLNALYSPWVEWTKLVQEWIAATSKNDMEKMQVFINTRVAETWELRGDRAEESDLEKRAEPVTENLLPDGVLLITMGVDVQRDRLVASLWGWGLDKEAWALDHYVIRKPPSLPEEHDDSPWKILDELIDQRFDHPSGKSLGVTCVCVDSGDQTKIVYDYTRKRERRRVYAIKGMPGFGKPLVNNGTRPDKNKTLLYGVGVDTAKEKLYSSLKLEKPGPSYVHILKKDSLGADYRSELTSEQLITTKRRGRTVLSYQVREGRRNEALDCAVYASAAREILRPRFEKLYQNLFGHAPLPRKLQVLVDNMKAITQAVKRPEPAPPTQPSSPQMDPFANLPIIGSTKQASAPVKDQNWRDSWNIF
jgi:phage terminase large subunit GpA-like protein